jgi:hypothetical protein
MDYAGVSLLCGGRKEGQVPLRRSIVASSLHSVSLVCLWERGGVPGRLEGSPWESRGSRKTPMVSVVVVRGRKELKGKNGR